MTTRPSWTETVTPNLKKDIEKIALSAYTNACELFVDAKALLRENRLARAGALVILAEEEFSKSFILLVCAQQHRWDSVIFYALKDHSPKQGIAGAMREYFEWFVDNYNRVSQMNRFTFIPITPSVLPGKKQWDDLIDKTKKEIKDKRVILK